MATIEIGMRELQRRMVDVMARIEDEGACAIVSRYGRPVALLVPLALAHPWVLHHRPLPELDEEDEAFWPVKDGVRFSPTADDALARQPEPIRRPLLRRLRRLRGMDAVGRVAVRVGQQWALADLRGDDPPTVLDVAKGAELRRWLSTSANGGQPM